MRIIGVDPGFGRTGIGIIDLVKGQAQYVWHSCIETPATDIFSLRLQILRDELTKALATYKPQAASVEKLFFQSNVKTAINVGMARGVIMLALADADLPAVELTPNEIKQAIAGYGSADKKQIQQMVTRLLSLKEVPKPDDAADALAIAMAGGFVYQTQNRLANN